jgi:hypothetical protein
LIVIGVPSAAALVGAALGVALGAASLGALDGAADSAGAELADPVVGVAPVPDPPQAASARTSNREVAAILMFMV